MVMVVMIYEVVKVLIVVASVHQVLVMVVKKIGGTVDSNENCYVGGFL